MIDDPDVFLGAQRGRLSGRTHGNHAVDARCELPVDQGAEGVGVDAVMGARKWGDECGMDAL